jgi:hypothetical protein
MKFPEGGGLIAQKRRGKAAGEKPKVYALVAWVHEKIFATSEEVAKHFKVQERYVEALLRARRDGVGDVVKAGDFWQRAEPKAAAPVLAGRMTRPFRPWDGRLVGASVRPGGLDFRQIPSLMGDKRVDYLTGEVL